MNLPDNYFITNVKKTIIDQHVKILTDIPTLIKNDFPILNNVNLSELGYIETPRIIENILGRKDKQIEYRLYPEEWDSKVKNLLYRCCANGLPKSAFVILNKYEVRSVDMLNNMLAQSCYSNTQSIIEYCLEWDVNINSGLIGAIHGNQMSVIKMLIDKGATIDHNIQDMFELRYPHLWKWIKKNNLL